VQHLFRVNDSLAQLDILSTKSDRLFLTRMGTFYSAHKTGWKTLTDRALLHL